MHKLSVSVRSMSLPLALLAVLVAMAFPAAASALSFEIVNESGRAAEDVYVTVQGEAAGYDVEDSAESLVDDKPVKLSEIPNQELTIDKLVSGRIYIAYGAPVTVSVPFDSPTRFDWAELTVTPAAEDVANLTAVDQFGIGMRLDTYGGSGEHLETVGDANSETIFDALQQIPGGPQATIRNGEGEIIRVLSPLHSSAYPDLGEYVRSMSGKTVTLHTAFFGTPFTTTTYSGTFAADGSIALHGSTDPISVSTPETIELGGAELIEDIYTGANTPNDIEGAIRRDLLSGFSAGFWGGRYGNDALSFCSDPATAGDGDGYCPKGFDQPSFGDARAALSPFPTCEQYAAVINQYSDVYGNPYSDASKKVAVALDQPVDGGQVAKLRLTVLPDSGSAMPSTSGNPNCGTGSPVSGGTLAQGASPPAKSAVALHLRKKARVRSGQVTIGTVSCPAACGRVRTIAKKGKVVLARGKAKLAKTQGALKLTVTGAGKKLLAKSTALKVEVGVSVTAGSGGTAQAAGSLMLAGGLPRPAR
jgi:Beta-1,3-glucanase